ncbi:MAG: type II secretion system minor pseudopilin GspJ [Magnetococcales bacterium]|nr:type II secretion system minor pseudopilin GspJ [Magnetococcales bacterium]
MAILANREGPVVTGGGSRGFTLLELLVALSVFVVLSVMAYQSVANMLLTRDIIEERTRNLEELHLFYLVLGNDLAQAVSRSVMGATGRPETAFRGGEQGSVWLLLTRAGRSNPRLEARSEFQRVAWLFEEGVLIRRSWRHLDTLGENPHHDEPLVRGVLTLELAFIDDKGEKGVIWPREEDPVAISVTLPRAVELTLEKKGVGRIRRIFELSPAPGWS